MKKIVTVLGARPQFVKAAAVSRAIAAKGSALTEYIINTGQHYDYNMSDLFFEELNIPKPHVNLAVGSGSHGAQTGDMMKLIEEQLVKLKPDAVVVYGDTNSTLAGALAAVKIHIPVAHVEAGLRSFNKRMPEEINRIVTDHVSDMLFVPTQTGIDNLAKEGIPSSKIFQSGDVMYDVVKYYRKRASETTTVLKDLNLLGKQFVLVTIHRAENTDNPERLTTIMNSLSEIATEATIVFPMHPRTRKVLNSIYKGTIPDTLRIVDPVGYLDMIALQNACLLVITDSGGVQKEAFMHDKFCITTRTETEWTELVDNGFNFLANPLDKLPDTFAKVKSMKFDNKGFQPYGDGHAAEKIVNTMIEKI